MTFAEAIKNLLTVIDAFAEQLEMNKFEFAEIEPLQLHMRRCNICKHSKDGKCAGTEVCHECMWESKEEQADDPYQTDMDDAWEQAKAEAQQIGGMQMTHKQAKSELMQIYGFLSEEKKKAIDVAVKALQEQDDPYQTDMDDAWQQANDKAKAMNELAKGLSKFTVPNRTQADGDLISRRAVEKITWEEPYCKDWLNVLTEVRDKVRELPSVAIPNKVGHWIGLRSRYCDDGLTEYECTECGRKIAIEDGDFAELYDYCPWCGKKMDWIER